MLNEIGKPRRYVVNPFSLAGSPRVTLLLHST